MGIVWQLRISPVWQRCSLFESRPTYVSNESKSSCRDRYNLAGEIRVYNSHVGTRNQWSSVYSVVVKGRIMSACSLEELRSKKCVPCEGGVPTVHQDEAEELLKELSGWQLSDDGLRIRRKWTVRDFMTAVIFLNQIAELAESEGHHPDLHLVGYRSLIVELTTHAIGGLSENDFITAAKIALLADHRGHA
jgi:4a-hydroxytetrahydrobiopterin dehydratase